MESASNPDNSATAPWAAADAPILHTARRVARFALPASARYQLYWRMLDAPGVSEAYIMSRGRLRHRRLSKRTRIVIEGYPSSGNSFSRQGFLQANPDIDPGDVNSHTHASRIVLRAVRAGIPCIVLVRDPRDAVASAVQRWPHVPLEAAFSNYQRYYRRLLPVRASVVVAPFAEVVSDFSAVLRRCNELYAEQFSVKVSSDAALASLEARDRARRDLQTARGRTTRPSVPRVPAAEFLISLSPAEQSALDGAVATWRDFTAIGPDTPTAC